jgi:hypothetical protein
VSEFGISASTSDVLSHTRKVAPETSRTKPPHANATLTQIRHLPAWIRSTRRHLRRSQARIDLLRKMLDLRAPRHHDVRPSLRAHAAPAAAFQTTRDLLQEILNPASARFHVSAAPARPRRVTPVALHELRDAHV